MFRRPYELIRAVTPHMRTRGWGPDRQPSRRAGGSFGEGLEGPGAYGVAKAALNAADQGAGARPARGGSQEINAVDPGWVRTRMGGEGATRSPEKEGAATAIWLADLPDDGATGRFFRDGLSVRW